MISSQVPIAVSNEQDFVSSNLVCNHTIDLQNWATARWESDLLVTSVCPYGFCN